MAKWCENFIEQRMATHKAWQVAETDRLIDSLFLADIRVRPITRADLQAAVDAIRFDVKGDDNDAL
jgi:hypothetical protein